MKFEIYMSNERYYEYKSLIKDIFNCLKLKWNNSRSGWFNNSNSVVKQLLNNKDRLLIVSGSEQFCNIIKEFSDEIFTEKRIEKEKKTLEYYIEKRVHEERAWCEKMGYNPDVGEYFTIRRMIDLNSNF